MALVRWLLKIAMVTLVVVGVWGGAHYYVWARIVRDTALPMSQAFAGLLVFLALLAILAMSHRTPRPFAGFVHAVAYSWMGAVLPLVLMLAVGDLVRLFVGNEQSLFEARVQAGVAAGVAALLSLYGWLTANRPPPVKRVEVTLPKWPRSLDGLRIVQVSDLHVDAAMTVAEVESLVSRINALEPDLVALTGDLVDGSPRDLSHKVAPLSRLRGRHGVWFVTGNHEYYSGGDRWIETFRSLGIGILHNERVTLGNAEARFELAGVPDWTGGQFGERHRPRLTEVLKGVDPALEVIVLAHQPRQFPEAAKLDVGLQLSGHTHGGQLWPFTHLVALAEPFPAGLYQRGRSQLYVSRGTGTWGPKMRTLAPHELTELTIRASA